MRVVLCSSPAMRVVLCSWHPRHVARSSPRAALRKHSFRCHSSHAHIGNSVVSSTPLLTAYKRLLAQGSLRRDERQLALIKRLAALQRVLAAHPPGITAEMEDAQAKRDAQARRDAQLAAAASRSSPATTRSAATLEPACALAARSAPASARRRGGLGGGTNSSGRPVVAAQADPAAANAAATAAGDSQPQYDTELEGVHLAAFCVTSVFAHQWHLHLAWVFCWHIVHAC